MRHRVFDDFDAFAESIDDIDSRMILVNPKRRIWTSSGFNLGGIDVQFGQLGSGNIGRRFAARYRRQFDELPSETLRTNKRQTFKTGL